MEAARTWHTEIVTQATQPRRGLVLGAGGVLGAAWSVGALCALQESTGIDPRTCDYIVGTSAGAVLAALLGSGVTPGELRDHQRGLVMRGRLADLSWNYDRSTGGALPPLPRLAVGSPALVRHNAWRLRRLPPTAVISALLPVGRGSLDELGELVTALAPGPEDLDAIGGNVMQASRRIAVLETSLRTSAQALAGSDLLQSTDTG